VSDVLRVILRLVGARSLNSLGRAVISATVSWELWERTQSALVLSAVGLVQVIPVFVLFVPSGALVDRSDRRSLTAIAAGGTGLVGIGLAIASFTDAHVAVFLALLCAQGCMTAIHSPGASSLVPLVVPRTSLERANRINATFSEMAQIGGPALAGVALHFVDAAAIYAFVALTGIAAGALYRSLPPPRAVEAAPNARRDWRVGLRFIFNSPLLLPALTLDMFAVLFAGAAALLPMVSTQLLHVGSLGYGVLRAAESAGAVLMALVGGRLPPWRRPGRVLLYVVALFGLATAAFGFSHNFVLSVALLVAMGALDNISVVIRLTLEQMIVPDAIRGRVSAVHYVFIGMSNELGAAESGLAADLFGLVGAIAGGGIVAVIVVAIVAVKWRALAAMPPLAELKPVDQAS
jgi:MFS family permease